MKKNNKLVTILLASTLLLPGIAPLATGVASVSAATIETRAQDGFESQYKTIMDDVVRETPRTNALPLAFVEEGETVEFVKDLGDKTWFEVKVGNKIGYMLRGNLTGTKDLGNAVVEDVDLTDKDLATEFIVATSTPLRTKNADRYRSQEVLKRGTTVKYHGTTLPDKTWFKVTNTSSGKTGYVKRADVTSADNFGEAAEPVKVDTPIDSSVPKDLRAIYDTSIREQPGDKFRIIAGLNRDEVVKYHGTTENKLWFLVELADGKTGYIFRGDLTKSDIPFEEEEEEKELMVESVSAINEDGVTVVIEAATEDIDEATVEVLDNEGNVVATKAELVAEGQTEVTFDFVTPLAPNYDFEGVWSVNGAEYNFDAINQFEAIEDAIMANNQVELLAALKDAGIENIDEDLITRYFEAIDEDDKAKDLADIQELINEANKEAGKEVDKVAAAKAVNEAKNQVQLLNALSANFDRVNKDWIVDYDGVITNPEGTANYETIQTAIDGVNSTKINNVTPENAKDQAAKTALIEKWMKPDAKNEKAKANAIKASKLAEAAFKVVETNTPNRLYNALVSFADLADDKDVLDAKDIKDENKLFYFEYLTDKETTLEDKITETPKVIVEKGNDLAIQAENKIKERITNTSVTVDYEYKDIENDMTINGYHTNFRVAIAETPTETEFDISDLSKVEVSLYKGKEVLATLTSNNVLENEDYQDLVQVTAPFDVYGDWDYVADNNDWTYSGWNGKITDVPTKAVFVITFKDGKVATIADETINGLDEEWTLKLQNAQNKVSVDKINEAETAEEVKVALDVLANDSQLDEYLNVTAADRIFIAEQVLEAREDQGEDKEYDSFDGVETAVTTATGARTSAINNVNGLAQDEDLTTIAEVLLAVGHESLTGKVEAPTANDTAIADAFITAVEFKEDKITPKFRSINAIRTAITNAIK